MSSLMSWFAGLFALLPGFGPAAAPVFTGYVDADYVYVAPVTGGVITRFPVKEGQRVDKGALLFTQTTAQEQALADAARSQAEAARAMWQNLTTGGRPEELAAAKAAVSKAEADLTLAQSNLQRSQKLFASNTITAAQLDQDQASVADARAGLNQAMAQLAVTGLPGRQAQQQAAEADYRAAQASAAKTAADLADRTIRAPAAGRIEKTYYDSGEMAAAGSPVLSLLPDGALKADFFVGETARAKLRLGEPVSIACDGCASGLTGTVSFLATDPQYTSPIIYSREERGQLVFLAEARIAEKTGVLPGQPVTVSLRND